MLEKKEININCELDVQYESSWFYKMYQKTLIVHSTTPLLEAISHGHLEVAKLLISLGANLHHKTRDGYTALHLAAYYHQLEAVEWLVLDNNFDMSLKDGNGLDAYAAAKGGGPSIQKSKEFNNHMESLSSAVSATRGDNSLRDAMEQVYQLPQDEAHITIVKYLIKIFQAREKTSLEELLKRENTDYFGFDRRAYQQSKSAYQIAKEEFPYLIPVFDALMLTEKKPTTIGMGCLDISTAKDPVTLIRTAMKKGVNHFDTADI